jgi:4-hydroxybenzoate polyprenyltransferase
MAPLLFGGSVALSLAFLPPFFLLVLATYYATTLLYSFWLKQKVLIDIVVLAGLYTIRIIAGGAATGIESSPWMLAFSMFFFLALAVVKRQAELVDMIRANDGRAMKRGYRTEDLQLVQSLGAASGYVSVLVLALYFNSMAANTLYQSPTVLWLICPLLLYWISRMLLLASRGHMHDDPIVFTTKDYVSYIVGACIAVVVAGSLLF